MSDKSCLIEKNVAVEQSDDTTQYYQQQNPQNSSNSNHPRNYGSIQTPDLPSSNNIDNSDSNYISNDGEMDNSRATLKFVEKIGFSLGHVYNDLAAGVWFSYTLLFFQGVLNMSSVMAGCLVMLGQVGDAICTPIVGIITDRFGTKRNWHIFGSILTLITFPMIFAICPFCDQFPLWWQPVYFSIVILIFQFGWPIIQVSHLSMVNELSRTQRDRGDLTASKYSMSVISNIVVYCVTWAVLRAHNSLDNKVSPSDYPKFRDIALILTLIGASMTVLFYFSLALSNYDYRRLLSSTQRGNVSITHTTTNSHPGDTERLLGTEPSSSNGALITNKSNGHVPSQVAIVVPKKNFLKSPLLYLNSLLYVFSRLFMTTSLVYMPLWLNERAWSGSTASESNIEFIATVPLVSFISSFVASLLIKNTQRFISHPLAYMLGSIVCVSSGVWVQFGASLEAANLNLFAIGILIGAGSSITMIASLCIIADMIGSHTDQGGFIYSTVTFCDKLITGLVVVAIESIKCDSHEKCPSYYRDVLAYTCGSASLLGVLVLSIRTCVKPILRRRHLRRSTNVHVSAD